MSSFPVGRNLDPTVQSGHVSDGDPAGQANRRLSAKIDFDSPPKANKFLAPSKSSSSAGATKAEIETEKAGAAERFILRPILALAKLAISLTGAAIFTLGAIIGGTTFYTFVGALVGLGLGLAGGYIADTAFKSMVNDLTIIFKGRTLQEVDPDSYFLKGFRE